MFKTKFKRWGFEKNVTEGRVKRFLRLESMNDGVRKVTGIDRIVRHLKRRKMQRNEDRIMPSGPGSDSAEGLNWHYNSSAVPVAYEMDTSSVTREMDYTSPYQRPDCGTCSRGRLKFRIEVEQLDQTSCRLQESFKADSWGDQKYDILDTRDCDESCQCRVLHHDTHVFHVLIQPRIIWVSITSPILLEQLLSIDDLREEKLLQTPAHLTSRLGLGAQYTDLLHLGIHGPTANLRSFRGLALLRSYKILESKTAVASIVNRRAYQELKLLLQFLEDGGVWHHYGFEKLQSCGILPEPLRTKFITQRLLRGVNGIDKAFKIADSRPLIEAQPRHIEERPPNSVALSSPPQAVLRTQVAASSERDDRGVTCYDDLETYGLLPTSRNVSSFYDNLPQQQPKLPSLEKSGTTGQVLPFETLNGGFGSVLMPAEFCSDWGPQKDSSLIDACSSGDLAAVRSLLLLGASANARVDVDANTSTPLIAAIENHQMDIASLLIEEGADLEQEVQQRLPSMLLEYGPLFAAVKSGSKPMVKLLLDKGADIEVRNTFHNDQRKSHLTALTEAARSRNLGLFEFLLAWDTTIDLGLKSMGPIFDGDSQVTVKANKLITRALRGDIAGIIEGIRTGADINAVTIRGTALAAAARRKKKHAVKLLLKHGANPQIAALFLHRSGLHEAAKRLLKVAYGDGDGDGDSFPVLRKRFVRQYKQISETCAGSNAANMRAFNSKCRNYRLAWSSGISTMKRVREGYTPTEVSETVAFLAVARAITETLIGLEGNVSLMDKFDNDLQRWQQLFPFDEDLESYRQIVQQVWDVRLTEACFFDTDYEDHHTLERFRSLIAALIDGAREPLGLEDTADSGLYANIARWRRRKRDDIQEKLPDDPPKPPEDPISSYKPGLHEKPPSQTLVRDHRPSPLTDPTFFEYNAARDKPRPPGRGQKISAHTIWLTENNGIAGFLIRGAMFIITLLFLRGMHFAVEGTGVLWKHARLGTLAERLSIFHLYFEPHSPCVEEIPLTDQDPNGLESSSRAGARSSGEKDTILTKPLQ
ncbi:hypothetical protein F5Y15DRAFT_264232 [Xylariaceae sp. FL0016]|nr:hypothetical protein F5Y15DRAFT_264232 [Xylariaceae sp. FL0016]